MQCNRPVRTCPIHSPTPAMQMNEVENEVEGTLVKFLVETGKPVLPGQPLVLIRP